jgi:hypothetical protein
MRVKARIPEREVCPLMAPDNAPEGFEWVSAQANCTAAAMFERLRLGVKQDVERRNALVGLDDAFRFEFSEKDEVFDVARLRSRSDGVTSPLRPIVRSSRCH